MLAKCVRIDSKFAGSPGDTPDAEWLCWQSPGSNEPVRCELAGPDTHSSGFTPEGRRSTVWEGPGFRTEHIDSRVSPEDEIAGLIATAQNARSVLISSISLSKCDGSFLSTEIDTIPAYYSADISLWIEVLGETADYRAFIEQHSRREEASAVKAGELPDYAIIEELQQRAAETRTFLGITLPVVHRRSMIPGAMTLRKWIGPNSYTVDFAFMGDIPDFAKHDELFRESNWAMPTLKLSGTVTSIVAEIIRVKKASKP
jgi:hypothetical protein